MENVGLIAIGCVGSISDLFPLDNCDCQVRGAKLGTQAELESRSFGEMNEMSTIPSRIFRGWNGPKKNVPYMALPHTRHKTPQSEFTLECPMAALWYGREKARRPG